MNKTLLGILGILGISMVVLGTYIDIWVGLWLFIGIFLIAMMIWNSWYG